MPSATFIDTHAHIYLPEFDADREDILNRAENITRIYMPNIDLESIGPMLHLHALHPERCLPMMGLHPCSVNEKYTVVLQKIEQALQQNQIKYYGIGETGLDYYWDMSFVDQQKKAFEQQIIWAKELRLPIIIHSRDSIDDCIALIEKHQDGNLTGIFHCFSGTQLQLSRAIDTGLMIGIGGVVTFKNGGLDKILNKNHLKAIVLETDAPYLAPVPYRGKRNEPAYIELIAKKLSEITEVSISDVAETTNLNAIRLFGNQPT